MTNNIKRENLKVAQRKYRARQREARKAYQQLCKYAKDELEKSLFRTAYTNNINKEDREDIKDKLKDVIRNNNVKGMLELNKGINKLLEQKKYREPIIQEGKIHSSIKYINEVAKFRPYEQRRILLQLLILIKQSSNDTIQNKLINITKDIHNEFEILDPIDKKYLKIKLSRITNIIAASGLSKDTQTILNNIIIDKENDNNADQKSQLGAVTYVEDMIPKLQRLQHTNNMMHISDYVLNIFSNNQFKLQSKLPLLAGLMNNSKLKGNNLFDFIADEKTTALDYVNTARQRMKQKLSKNKIQLIKKDIPFLFSNKIGRIMGYLKLAIEDANLPKDSSIDNHNKSDILNESWLLSNINKIFNQYLIGINVIVKSKDGKLELSDYTIQLLKDKNIRNRINQYLRFHHVFYKPDASWDKVFSYGLDALKWVNKHKEDYSYYYGLVFAFMICGLKSYHAFTRFTSIEDHKQYDLAIYPLVYISIMLNLYTDFFSDILTNRKIRRKDLLKIYRRLKVIESDLQEYYRHVDIEKA